MSNNANAVEAVRSRLHAAACERIGKPRDHIFISGCQDTWNYNDAFKEIAAEMIADYENGISWNTTCTGCASLLDDNYTQYCELERLRGTIDGVVEELGGVSEYEHPFLVELREVLRSAIHGQDESSLPQSLTPIEIEAILHQEPTTALSTCASHGSPGRYSRFSSHRGLGRRTLAR